MSFREGWILRKKVEMPVNKLSVILKIQKIKRFSIFALNIYLVIFFFKGI